jgi:protein-S-isoprenylcysteine O-methyltransferase Ste14
MTTGTVFRYAFLVLLLMLLAMRVYFMIRVRCSGGRIMPDEGAIQREGGGGIFLLRVAAFLALNIFLVMYFLGAKCLNLFSFTLPGWLRWAGFGLGVISVIFWTWAQVALDTQWSAQLQLTGGHHLVTNGPYTRIRHPLYSGMIGWSLGLSLLTANWIFVAVSLLSIAGVLHRVPKEEQMMIDTFGEQYKAYMQRTGRFFPKL